MTRRSLLAIPLALCTLGVCTASASASPEAPAVGWYVSSHSYPTNLPPGGIGHIFIDIFNIGATPSSGPITVTDTLPAGVRFIGLLEGDGKWECAGATVVTCTSTPAEPALSIKEDGEANGDIRLEVETAPGAPEGTRGNLVTVSGGGAAQAASATSQVAIAVKQAGFGIQDAESWFSGAGGTLDTQAGSHPYAFFLRFDLNTAAAAEPKRPGELESHTEGQEFRNLNVNLPPGFVGNAAAMPQCTRQSFDNESCPATSQVGWNAAVTEPGYANLPGATGTNSALYNLVPPPGVAAEFGFNLFGNAVITQVVVRSGGDYGITSHTNGITQRNVRGDQLVLWGEPSDPRHNVERCGTVEAVVHCDEPFTAQPVPYLTLPTSCEGPQKYSLSADTWADADKFASIAFEAPSAGFTGCNLLGFEPSLQISPGTSATDTPAGLTADLQVPQHGLLTAGEAAASNIKDTTVALPPGLVINPGQAAGLAACQPAEAGVGIGEEPGDEAPASCPPASKVGTFEVQTPLLPDKFEGNVYVLQSNPPDLKLLLAASADGVNIKLAGDAHLCETAGEVLAGKTCQAPGQLITTFEHTPELPFTDFKLAFNGGAQAALDTPASCGVYTTGTQFTPWSSPFVAEAFSSSSFAIAAGAGGGACPASPLPFAPNMTAGSTTDQAGGFTNFSLLLQRGDDQQRIDGLQFKAPAGLTGELGKVPLCSNAQAETNTCPEASKIGHTVVESGPGPYPLVVPEPGQEPAPIYLTGPYNGSGACTPGESGCAPFGLSVVVPLHVGPFVLPTQRIRAKIELNPSTAALTVTTNPLPQVVAGVPTDLREVDAVIEHPEFMINPTSCNPSEFSGTVYGTPPPGQPGSGAQAPISSHFGVGACRSLEFTPKVSFSTSGKTSKANGADLVTKVIYPSVPQGSQANIGYVKVELPKQLPSRLTTLQKACLAKVFEANPADCPPESLIGHAVVHTPLLPVPLEGPAIFVSHGGEAFPSLTMVLQGYGVKIDLVGTTFISKAGITSTTFKTVPDQPFSSFELTLPEGPYSALGTNYNLCTQKLEMPNEFIGQNGAKFSQSTRVEVTGCGKSLSVVSSKVNKRTLTLSVYAPAAGKVTTSAKGLSAGVKTYSGNEAQTFTLKQSKAGKLKTKIKLTFTPKFGKHQTKTLAVRFKK